MRLELWCIYHPHTKGYITSSEENAYTFISKNAQTWEEYGLDIKLFTVESVYVKDSYLSKVIADGMPELLL